jgi:hypothetical protein
MTSAPTLRTRFMRCPLTPELTCVRLCNRRPFLTGRADFPARSAAKPPNTSELAYSSAAILLLALMREPVLRTGRHSREGSTVNGPRFNELAVV